MSLYQFFYHGEENYGLKLNFCGIEDCEKGYAFGPAIRQTYLFHYILEGRGSYHVGGNKFELEQGQGFLIRPGESTIYVADKENPWTYAWFAFSGVDVDKIIRQSVFRDSNYIYTASDHQVFHSVMTEMIEKTRDQDTLYLQQLSRLYNLLSIMIHEESSKAKKPIDYIETAIDFIHTNYPSDIRVTDIAQSVGLERSYLYRLFMKEMNMSPKDYLIGHRLLMAKQMLSNESLSITEVAYSCGFQSSSAFYKQFSKAFRTTPKLFRTGN